MCGRKAKDATSTTITSDTTPNIICPSNRSALRVITRVVSVEAKSSTLNTETVTRAALLAGKELPEMGENTKIAWADHTFQSVDRVRPGVAGVPALLRRNVRPAAVA